MKAVTIIYNISTDEEVQEVLRRMRITEYTRITRVMGVGAVTGPRMDDHVWPGYNAMIVACVSDHHAETIMQALQEVGQRHLPHEGQQEVMADGGEGNAEENA